MYSNAMWWVFFFSTEEQSEGTCPKPRSEDPRGGPRVPHRPPPAQLSPTQAELLTLGIPHRPLETPRAAADDDDRCRDRQLQGAKRLVPDPREQRKEPQEIKGCTR